MISRQGIANLLADPDYTTLKAHLVSWTGLDYYMTRDDILTEIIAHRLAELNVSTCLQYIGMLHGEDRNSELRTIADRMVIGETYFFRNRDHFTALRNLILPELLRRKAREKRLSIWSAGCACGAETYSISILLKREFGPQLAEWDVRIVGTDISQTFLDQARRGQFADWAFRSTPEDLIDSCFRKEGRFRTIVPEYKDRVFFEWHNLVDGPYPPQSSGLQSFDIVLCRNVFIYFSPEGAARVTEQFHSCLADGGWLLVGASETNVQAFRMFETVPSGGPALYQKARKQNACTVGSHRENTWVMASQIPELKREIHETKEPELVSDEQGLRALANRGDWAAAARCCERMLERESLNPRTYFYYALIADHLGEAERATELLRKAIYLDREFLLAHYHFGLALKRENSTQQAAHHFRVVLELLDRIPEEQTLPEDRDLSVVELKALTKLQLEVLTIA